jgi:hypothetical protein
MDLRVLGVTLRACWLWLHRSDSGHSWAALSPSEDATTMVFFNTSIQMTLGNDEALLFWIDPWLHGAQLEDITSELTAAVSPRRQMWRSVACALHDNSCARNIMGPLTVPVLLQYLDIWHRI